MTRAIQTKRAEKPPQTSTITHRLPSRLSERAATTPHDLDARMHDRTAFNHAVSSQWDKNGLTCAPNYAILRMEPPKERFRRANNPKVGSTPNIAAPLFQIAPNNLQTPLSNTLIAFGGSIQKIFMRSPPRAGYALRRRKVLSVRRYRSINYFLLLQSIFINI